MSIKSVTVIGGGLMGAGIAQTAASFGFNVILVEVSAGLAQKSLQVIEKNLTRTARRKFKDNTHEQARFVRETMARINANDNLAASVSAADLVIEAIVEQIAAKHDLFSKIDLLAPAHTIFVSNTSSLLIGDIAKAVSAERRSRFAGLHFFSPVPLMRLVEIVRIGQTTDATFEAVQAFATAIGKTSIACKDSPMFVVNCLLIPFSAHALRLVESNVSTIRDIDIAMKLGAGHPVGPFELMDNVGIDVCYNILNGLHENDPQNNAAPPEILRRMVDEGKLGVKSGQGFYNYMQ